MKRGKNWKVLVAVIVAFTMTFSNFQMSFAVNAETPAESITTETPEDEGAVSGDNGEGLQQGESDESSEEEQTGVDEGSVTETDEQISSGSGDSQNAVEPAAGDQTGRRAAKKAPASPLKAAGDPSVIEMQKRGIQVNIFDYGPADIENE